MGWGAYRKWSVPDADDTQVDNLADKVRNPTERVGRCHDGYRHRDLQHPAPRFPPEEAYHLEGCPPDISLGDYTK